MYPLIAAPVCGWWLESCLLYDTPEMQWGAYKFTFTSLWSLGYILFATLHKMEPLCLPYRLRKEIAAYFGSDLKGYINDFSKDSNFKLICNSSCEYLRQVSKFHREVLLKWIPEAVNLRRTSTHKECICRKFSLQTRLGGEICSSDVIMHKGPLLENHFLARLWVTPRQTFGR